MIYSKYLDRLFSEPKYVVDAMCRIIRKEFPECGGIVTADGISGVSIIMPLALKLKKPYAIVRLKKGSHSHLKVEGHRNIDNYVFVDDFIGSAKTLRRTCATIYSWNRSRPCGAVLYCGLEKLVPYYVRKEKFKGIPMEIKVIE